MTDLDDLVDVLLDDRMLVEVAEAVRDDERYAELVRVCATLSGGEAGTLSLVFGEVSDALDADPAALWAVVEADAPAVAFGELLRAHHDGMRAAVT